MTAAGMFGFGFALVPLYDVFCEITGLNGKTGVVREAALDGTVDETREVTVEFVANVNSALPWDFRPVQYKMRVHPGKVYATTFFAHNRATRTLVGQAVPSVSPAVASKYFDKTECFCFTNQVFAAGESRDMPVRFVVGTGLPKDVNTVTLAYTFFNVDEKT